MTAPHTGPGNDEDRSADYAAGDAEALAVEVREREITRQLQRDPHCIASSDTPRTFVQHVLASDWLADLLARERAKALQEAAAALGPSPKKVVLRERESCDWWDEERVDDWLRERADRIARTTPEGER